MGSKDKAKCESDFKAHFSLSDEDMKFLWECFMKYGMNGIRTGEPTPELKRPSHHYFFQGIGQYFVVDWKEYGRKMHKDVKKIIEEKYPQLMVTNKDFEWL